jgi:hypothetical protein
MDGRQIDPVSDTSLDHEIESLVAAEPSTEFLARVRARVAEEPTPNRWRASWTFAAATAVAAVIVALTVWPSSEPAPSSSALLEVPGVARSVETITPPPSSAAPARLPTERRTARAVVVAASSDRAIEIDLPEVVVADNEKIAYATLVSSIRRSRFDVAVPAAPDPNMPLEVKELPPVEPLEIEPIVKLATLE